MQPPEHVLRELEYRAEHRHPWHSIRPLAVEPHWYEPGAWIMWYHTTQDDSTRIVMYHGQEVAL